MIEGRTNPLDIARRVLKPETIREIRAETWPQPNLAYSILDRWALNSPDILQTLETYQESFGLILRLDQQATLEARTLASDTAWTMRRNGMNDWEILSALGVETELRVSDLF